MVLLLHPNGAAINQMAGSGSIACHKVSQKSRNETRLLRG